MKVKIAVYTLCIVMITVVQSTVLEYLTVYGIKPNLLVVFAVSVALLNGNVEGAVVGFFTGLAQDLASGKIVGFYALIGLYLGLITGSVNKRLYRENYFVVILFTFTATSIYELTVYLLGVLINGHSNILFAIRSIILPEALYNSIASIFVYNLAVRLNVRFDGINKASRKY